MTTTHQSFDITLRKCSTLPFFFFTRSTLLQLRRVPAHTYTATSNLILVHERKRQLFFLTADTQIFPRGARERRYAVFSCTRERRPIIKTDQRGTKCFSSFLSLIVGVAVVIVVVVRAGLLSLD